MATKNVYYSGPTNEDQGHSKVSFSVKSYLASKYL